VTTEPTPAVTTEPTPVVTTSPSAPAPAAALTSPSCEDQPAPIETTPAASDPGIDAAVAVGLIAVAVALGLLGGLRPWSRRSSS
jgi:hypothetical protein